MAQSLSSRSKAMRSLILLTLLGLAAASWHTESFREGRLYRYHFNGQVSAGMPLPDTHHSITNIKSEVELQLLSEHTAVMRMRNVRFASTQEEKTVQELSKKTDKSLEMTELSSEFQRLLSLPFRFSYRHGLVSDIEFQSEEQTWTANIKRAVLNMIQVNMKKTLEVEERTENINENDYFTTAERTLEGECEVSYTKVFDLRNKEMQLTKSVNFDKCSVRPEIVYGRRHVQKCAECEKTFSSEKLSSTVLNYNITGTPEKFLIREVELRSQHSFAPLNDKQKLFVSFVHNKLVLHSVEETRMMEEVRGERKESLIYNPEQELAEEKFAMTGEEKYLRRLPEWNNKVEMVEKLLNKIAKQMDLGVELETSHMVARVVKVLRQSTEEEINKMDMIFRELSLEKKTEDKLRSIFYDALALAGTKTTIYTIVEKTLNKEISPIKTSRLLKTISEIRTPSEKIAEEIERLCESEVAIRSPVLRQSCMLTYGSVIYGFCGETEDKLAVMYETKKICSRELKEKFIRKLFGKLDRSETRYEKVLVLKTIANAAIDMSVFDLEKIISSDKYEKIVRIQAIDSLRRLRNVMSRKIQTILMPIYKNRMEIPEIRMSALHMIIATLPEKSVVDQIVYGVDKERSQQIRSFTISTLLAMTKSTNPCEKEFASRVSQTLSLIPEQKMSLLMSRKHSFTLFDKMYQTGAQFNFATLFSNDSFLPKEVMASLESVFGGEWNKYLAQIGFSQNNLDVVLSKLIHKMEESGLEQLVVRGKRSTVFRPTDLLRSLYDKLRITRREYSTEEPHAMLYFRYKDMDYAFLPIDIDTMPEMIKNLVHNGKIELGDLENILSQGAHFFTSGAAFFHEQTRKIPTALGMPVFMSTKTPTVATMQGHIKVDIEPKSSDRVTGLRFRLVAKPEVAATNIIKVEIESPVMNNGVKLLHSAKFNLPIDTVFEMNWEKEFNMKTIVKTPESKRHILHMHSRPLTFVRVWPKHNRQYMEPVEKTIVLKEIKYPMMEIEREYTEKTTGYKMIVSGNIHRSVFKFGVEEPKPIIVGDNVLDVIIEPTTETPREIVIRMEMEAFEPVERMEKPEFANFFEKKDIDLFEVEDGDYKDEDETERRTYFHKYYKNFEVTKTYKHRVAMRVETVGDRKTRNVDLKIIAICDDKIRFCNTNMEIRRSAYQDEEREWEMNAKVQTLYPDTPKSLKQLLEQPHREFNAIVDVNWGMDKENWIKVKVQGEQSREQKKWMKRAERDQSMLSEEDKLTLATRLNQYKAVAEYEILPETRFQIEKLYSLIKSWKIMSTEIEPSMTLKVNRVELQLTIEPVNRRICNFTVQTSYERMQINDIVFPISLPASNIRSIESVRSVKHVAKSFSEYHRAECVVKSKEVKTFDETFFRAPLTSCYSVLAKDCSSEEPRFAVLMKKVQKTSEDKKIKIISRENVIELEKIRHEIVVKINNKEVTEERKMEEYGIERMNEKLYKVDIDDLIVYFDGENAKIKLSVLYKNRQCGICGHYDGENNNDFRLANNVETTDLEEFHRSFLSLDEECEKDESELSRKSNYRRLTEETSSSEESSEFDIKEEKIIKKPELRTLKIERGHRTCFSVEPVNECIKCEQYETMTRDVEFKCLRTSEHLVRKLMKVIRHNKVIRRSSLDDIEDVYTKTITLPKTCVVY